LSFFPVFVSFFLFPFSFFSCRLASPFAAMMSREPLAHRRCYKTFEAAPRVRRSLGCWGCFRKGVAFPLIMAAKPLGSAKKYQSPFTIHHSPTTIHHSPTTIHQPPFTIHHSPFTIPFTVHHSPN